MKYESHNQQTNLEELETLKQLLNSELSTNLELNLGKTEMKEIKTKLSGGKYEILTEYKIIYPVIVKEALKELIQEYNNTFAALIRKNKEAETDYQYCKLDNKNGLAVEVCGVQIDMTALTPGFLQYCELEKPSVQSVKEILRGNIYEIENSLAMYNLAESLFEDKDKNSKIRTNYREMIGQIREKTGKKIILLAVTEEKYEAMLQTEFGVIDKSQLAEKDVATMTGFDAFMSPNDFISYLNKNNGECNDLLYVRASNPVYKLKNPNTEIKIPLLENDLIRQTIKANSLTLNIDNPNEYDVSKNINDTKEYMLSMKMGFACSTLEDILHNDYIKYLTNPSGEYRGLTFNQKFVAYLINSGCNPDEIRNGTVALRAKPEKGTYGGYGHINIPNLKKKNIRNKDFRRHLKSGLDSYGAYIIQPEMPVHKISNIQNGVNYISMDRIFVTKGTNGSVNVAGLRLMLDEESKEAKKGNIHGTDGLLLAEVI